MQLILPVIYSLLFIFLIYKIHFFALENVSKLQLILLFILKLITGIVVLLVYTHYYSGSDFHLYFSDSKILLDNIFGDSSGEMQIWNSRFDPVLFNSSRTMIILHAILRIFSFGNFYVHIVFFCFFSFIGLTGIFKAFSSHFPHKNIRLLIGIFLVPSVLFWGSAALKEPVVICLSGLLIWMSDFGLKRNMTLAEKIICFLLLLSLLFVKMYVALALMPVLAVNMLVSRTTVKYIFMKYLIVFGLFGLAAFCIKLMNSDYNVLRLIVDKQTNGISEIKGGLFLISDKNFVRVDYNTRKDILVRQHDSVFKIKEGSNYLSWEFNNMSDTTFVTNSTDTSNYIWYYAQAPGNSVIHLKRLQPELLDFILYSPKAILNVISRPTVFEITSWLHLIAAIENLWILMMICLAVFFFDKGALKKKEVLLFCLIFSIILFILIGITVPSMGAMVRYRAIGLIFFVPMCLLLIDQEKLKKRLNFASRPNE